MSDDITITSGGAVAVDTGSLRHAADRLRAEAAVLDDLRVRTRASCARLQSVGAGWGGMPQYVVVLDVLAGTLADEGSALAGLLERAASVYDVIEQRVAVEQAERSGDERARRLAEARLDALVARDPSLEAEADATVAAFERERSDELRHVVERLVPGGPPLGLFNAPPGPVGSTVLGADAAAAVGALGLGRMYAGTTGADPGPVTVRQVGPAASGRPPAGLGDMIARIPSADDRSVRVERYRMPDGSTRYLAYIRGTRDWGFGGAEPNNMQANLQLYGGERSTSLKAAQRALQMAGAKPGDAVGLVAHSQGAMIAGRIALDGPYRTDLLVTAGSPTQAQVPEGVLSVRLEHPDVVSNLQGAGSPAPVGSEGSVTIHRDPQLEGGPTAAHAQQSYVETARLADLSPDSRLNTFHGRVADLQGASGVDVFEFDSTVPEQPPRVRFPTWKPGMQ